MPGCISQGILRRKLFQLLYYSLLFIYCKVSYVDRIRNEDFLESVGQERQLFREIEKRQLRFLGHYIRKDKLEDLSLSGRLPGKRAQGRPQTTFLNNFNIDARTLWNKARDRSVWKDLVRRGPNRVTTKWP